MGATDKPTDLKEIVETTFDTFYADELSKYDAYLHLLKEFLNENSENFQKGQELSAQEKVDLKDFLETEGYMQMTDHSYAILTDKYEDWLILPHEDVKEYIHIHLTDILTSQIFYGNLEHHARLKNTKIYNSHNHKQLGLKWGLASTVALMIQNLVHYPTLGGTLMSLIPTVGGLVLGTVADCAKDYSKRRQRQSTLQETEKQYSLFLGQYTTTGIEAITNAFDWDKLEK